MSSEELKIIFFDATGTLLHIPHGVGYHYHLIARRNGLEIPEEWFRAAFRSVFKSMPVRSKSGKPRPDDDKGWWQELVYRVLEQTELRSSSETGRPLAPFDREKLFADLYGHFATTEAWELYPEVEEVLGRLGRRFRLGVISNFDSRLRKLLAAFRLDQRFDCVVLSSEVGADKPDPYIFERALDLAGVEPAQALHAGDDPADWEGAAAAGLRYFKLARPANSLLDLAAELGV